MIINTSHNLSLVMVGQTINFKLEAKKLKKKSKYPSSLVILSCKKRVRPFVFEVGLAVACDLTGN